MKKSLLILTLSLLSMNQAFASAIINLEVEKGTYVELDDTERTNIVLKEGSKILSLRDGEYYLKWYDTQSGEETSNMHLPIINGLVHGKKIKLIASGTLELEPQ